MLSIAAHSRLLGVHPPTVRRWEREGRSGLIAPVHTPGNHRRYPIKTEGRLTVGCARVSSHNQEDDLPRQVARLEAYAAGHQVVIVKDIGSGLNCNKPGLRKLLGFLLSGDARELILTYKDQLLRFGSELVFFICQRLGVKVVTILNAPKQ